MADLAADWVGLGLILAGAFAGGFDHGLRHVPRF